jgi:tRNA-dihydrouridine synthase B
MQIGQWQLKNKVLAAPMAGFTTRAYRDILRQHGAALAYGEMISAQALVYNNQRTFELLQLAGEESPRVVQLFGSKPDVMSEAARIVQDLGADIIDINMGCPSPKIVRNGEGAALLRDLPLAARIMHAVSHAVNLPVTAKLRLGWSADSINCREAAQILEAAGAAAIALHGRTRDQFYSGQADWSQIAAVKKLVQIPVIGNGDIFSAADAQRRMQESGCDAVMIGRGMVGNPWLIRECVAILDGQELPQRPSQQEILRQALLHLQRQIVRDIFLAEEKQIDENTARAEGEKTAVRSLRAHLAWYIKGLPQAARMRCRINQSLTAKDIEILFEQWLVQMGESP